jgi:hypothetical protein
MKRNRCGSRKEQTLFPVAVVNHVALEGIIHITTSLFLTNSLQPSAEYPPCNPCT